jgi:hypothetical protein
MERVQRPGRRRKIWGKLWLGIGMAISYNTNHSILWAAIIHRIFSWLYVVYFALFFS